MSKHYIATAGMRGAIIPETSCQEAFASAGLAAAYLAELHDLSDEEAIELETARHIEIDVHRYGNEYCHIEICNCDDPVRHCRSGVYEELPDLSPAPMPKCELCEGIATRVYQSHHLCTACQVKVGRERLLREQAVIRADQKEQERLHRHWNG